MDVRLREVQQRLSDKHITMDVDEHGKAWLADKGYDTVYGTCSIRLRNDGKTLIIDID